MPSISRIDTHHHVLPPEYRSWLEGQGQTPGGVPLPTWDASSTIGLMDDLAVATAIVSVSAPGVHLDPAVTGPDAVARSWARKVNEFAAELVKDHPDRFGFFATLTLPDVEGAIAEAEYAFDVLGADGVILLTNAHGTYLGDATFDPLFDALDERAATIFVHPSELPGPTVAGVPSFAADFLLEDTRAAIKLAMSRTLDRYGRVKIIISHGGGFVPYQAYRFAPLCAPDSTVDSGIETLKRFYFDTTACSSPSALPSLLAFADPRHITFGTDWPWVPPGAIAGFTDWLDSFDMHGDQLHAIDRGNAEVLFPRLGSGSKT
jgi:predicted TIM-barrel fold metal-dependent hydrolase